MKKIGVLSDTHGFLPKQVYSFFKDCDELWHAGDIGPWVLDELHEALDGMPLGDVHIMQYLKEMIAENLKEIGANE